jgi:hypothetical protein
MTAHKKWLFADKELAEPEGQDEQDGGIRYQSPALAMAVTASAFSASRSPITRAGAA